MIAMEKIKVAIVDDHKLFRSGLRSILQQNEEIEILFEATNGQDLLDNPLLDQVDVILLDIQMPILDGIKTTKILREENNPVKIIILSMHDEDQFVLHLMEIGANGYLLKDTDTDEMIKAIKKVNEDGIYFSDFVSKIMLRKVSKNPQKTARPFNFKTDLSQRELDVVKNICDGLTTHEIGELMCISHRTVEGHRQRILEKLGLSNTAKLVAYAIKNGLV
jgi:DNA-binding NarL/FixJ family response regulator